MTLWKKHIRRLLCLALLGLVFLSAAVPGVYARPPVCSLTVDYVCEGVALSGVTFRLYRMAELNDRYEPVYTGAFSDVRLETDNLEEQVLDLCNLVVEQKLQPAYTLTTDAQGKATLPEVEGGVFLLTGGSTTVDGFTYYVDAQILRLPVQAQGQWENTLTLNPKSTRLPSPELTQITVIKRWEDRGYEADRPKAIQVSLLRDGKKVSTVVLDAACDWRYTWPDLLPNANWQVSEAVPKDYTMTLEQQGNTFILTNHRKTIPQTGQIWWPVIAALGLGLVLMATGASMVRGKRRDA